MRSVAAVAAVLVLGMGVTGCGSGRDQSAPSAQPTTPTPTPAPTSASTPASMAPAAPATPSRAQVVWIAGMCTNRSRLTSLQTGPPIRGLDPGPGSLPPQFGEHAAMFNQLQVTSYLANVRAGLRDLATRSARLPATGIPAADALAGTQLRRLQSIAPAVFRLVPTGFNGSGLSPEEQVRRAQRAVALFRSVGAPAPALRNVVRQAPLLAAAYRSAPDCR